MFIDSWARVRFAMRKNANRFSIKCEQEKKITDNKKMPLVPFAPQGYRIPAHVCQQNPLHLLIIICSSHSSSLAAQRS